jgi:hypothetical protein
MSIKREQWALIQSQSPDIAKFMTDFAKAFGKPLAIKVELASGEIIESGEFSRDKCKWDGSARTFKK